MDKKAKALTGLLVIVSLISLGLAAASGYFLKQEIDKNKSLEQKLQSIEAARTDIENKLQQAKNDIVRLQAQLNDSQGQVASITSELQGQKNKDQDLNLKIGDLESALKQAKSDKDGLIKQLDRARQDLGVKEQDLQDLTKLQEELQKKIKDLETKAQEGVQLGRIVVKQGISPGEPGANILEGKVLSVNKKYSFVIVNLGKNDGIQIGDILTVYSKDKPLGNLKVEKVYDKLAAANFLPQIQKAQITEGLRVTRP